jgi:hypothetical protein
MTENKFTGVDLVFENCEYARIPGKYIRLFLDGYKRSGSIWNMGDLYIESECFDNTLIVVSKEVNEVELPQPGLFSVKDWGDETPVKMDLIRLINRPDITQVEIRYEDPKDNKTYYPDWDPSDDNYNSFQENILGKNGNLMIRIVSPENDKESYYMKDSIENFRTGHDYFFF